MFNTEINMICFSPHFTRLAATIAESKSQGFASTILRTADWVDFPKIFTHFFKLCYFDFFNLHCEIYSDLISTFNMMHTKRVGWG